MSHDPTSPAARPHHDQRTAPTAELTPAAKRPYQKPAFVISQAFERQALSCLGCLNQSGSFPAFCAMRS